MNKTILITGISGFLGSAIAEIFIKKNFSIIGLRRSTSDIWRCKEFENEIKWVDCDVTRWNEEIVALKPEIIIHTAWTGVQSNERDDIRLQLKNLELISELLTIAKKSHTKCLIGLGSQAEYGVLKNAVSEEAKSNPVNAYGISKILASTLVEKFCDLHKIKWYWLRIFSVFGEKESAEWFIPFVIRKFISNENEIKLSPCDQAYAYLYIKDFAQYIYKMIIVRPPEGIYNISGSNAKSLKMIVEDIKTFSGNTKTGLNFGSLPKREGQSDFIEGDMRKFHSQVGEINLTGWQDSITNTISFYKNIHNFQTY